VTEPMGNHSSEIKAKGAEYAIKYARFGIPWMINCEQAAEQAA